MNGRAAGHRGGVCLHRVQHETRHSAHRPSAVFIRFYLSRIAAPGNVKEKRPITDFAGRTLEGEPELELTVTRRD